MDSKAKKIGWLYAIAAIFIAISLFLVVKKNSYLFYALPIVLCIMALYVFSLDKVLMLTSFCVPLSIVIDRFSDLGLAISLPSEPLLMGILLVFTAKMLYDGQYDHRVTRHPISIVILCMFFWMLVTTITSELPIVSLKFIASRLWFIVPAFYICAILFKKPKNIDKFIWLYIAALCIVCVYTIVNHARNGFSGSSAHWVMTPFYNDHTAYGAALAIYLILALTYVFVPGVKRSRRYVIIGVVALLGLALFLSNCRAAWLSIIAAAGVLCCVLLKIKFRWIATVAVALIGLFMVFQNQIIDAMEKNKQDASGDFMENVQSITNISTDASNLERINRWQSAFRLFEERPVFGWGPGTYQFVYAPFQMSEEKTIISTNAGDGGNAHSEYFGPLAEQGLIGSLLVFALAITTVYCGLKTYKRCKNKKARVMVLGATLAFISYAIHGGLNNFLDTDKLSIPVWSCAALIVAIDLFYAEKETFTEEEKQES